MARSAPRVAVLGGDGIGPEIVASAARVLLAVRPDCLLEQHAIGGAALDEFGAVLPSQTAIACERADAILFGAVGGPQYDGRAPEERPEAALLGLRKHHALFVNLRPVRPIPGLEKASSLRPEFVRGVDLVVVRELTGGAYFGAKSIEVENGERVARDAIVYRDHEVRRITGFAFELARVRRRSVTSVDKQNVLATSRLWRDIVADVGKAYRDVALEHMLVDTAAMQLVRDPRRFDVIVTENMFGDILSDEAAMIAGSLGNLPSASFGERTTPHGTFGLYEPISGSAPDIAGKGIANPIAAILSAALLCRHSLNDEAAALRIESAVRDVIAAGARTADIAQAGETSLSTGEMTAAILDAVERAAVGVP